jgi:hypothetical protein
MADSVYGYDLRPPHPGEDAFFRRNLNVGGMAAEDGRITLNPHSSLTGPERQAVARNEAVRLHQRDLGIRYTFPLTDAQKASFAGGPYASGGQAAQQTVVARALSGDPSAGELTDDQRAAAAMTQAHIDMILRRLR